MKKKLLLISVLFAVLPAFAQTTCSAFMGIGAVQFTDNLGAPLTNGALYVYQASTSTQAPSYSDSACTQLNTNPVTFTTGGRAQIWINTGSFFKYVLCQVSTDGPACSSTDQLFSIDNVPGGATGGGGGGAPFISSSANPSTSGVLRCASGDQCFSFRNAANSGNLPFTKDVNDVFSVPIAIKMPAVGQPTGLAAGFSHIWNDNTANRWKVSNNGATAAQLVVSGNDIGTTDQVLGVHFGSSQETFGSTAPANGQFLFFNGTNIVGTSTVPTAASADATAQQADIGTTTLYAVPASGAGTYRISCYIVITQAATTSSTLPQCIGGWTGKDPADIAHTVALTANAQSGNVAGTTGIVTGSFYGVMTVEARASTNITYNTSGYASSGATAMQFAIHVKVEYLGP